MGRLGWTVGSCGPRAARVAVAVVLAASLVVGLGEANSAIAGRGPLLAAFGARSYRPGRVGVLRIDSSPVQRLTLRIFSSAAEGTTAVPPGGHDPTSFGQAVTDQLQFR